MLDDITTFFRPSSTPIGDAAARQRWFTTIVTEQVPTAQEGVVQRDEARP